MTGECREKLWTSPSSSFPEASCPHEVQMMSPAPRLSFTEEALAATQSGKSV